MLLLVVVVVVVVVFVDFGAVPRPFIVVFSLKVFRCDYKYCFSYFL